MISGFPNYFNQHISFHAFIFSPSAFIRTSAAESIKNASINFVMPVGLSAYSYSRIALQIFMKCDIGQFYTKIGTL
jgi:hypothetical protein